MSRKIIKDCNGKRKEVKFLHNNKCDICNKWLDDYAFQLTKNDNCESNYCGGHTSREVEQHKAIIRRKKEFEKNAKIYGSWTFSRGKF